MTLSTEPHANGHLNDPLEDRLRTFFRGAMPNPWPRFNYPETVSVRPVAKSGWFRRPLVRLALAASILLLVVGYLALAQFFPTPAGGGLNHDPSREIGDNPHKVIEHRGNKVLMKESTQRLHPGQRRAHLRPSTA